MTDKTYNGWTNYATWRVNLEIFDGMDFRDVFGNRETGAWAIGKECKEYAENLIYEAGGGEGNLAVDYALAFLSDVNWYEIAEHLLEDEQQEEEEENQEIDLDGGVSAINEQQEESEE